MGNLRFHGRGGEGVKLAARIVSRAAFECGRFVQDSPLYGAERRGAPVVAFTRISDRPIHERGYIEAPDAVVVMDASLLEQSEAGVLTGVRPQCLVLVNTPQRTEAVAQYLGCPARLATADLTGLALHRMGKNLLSAAVASFTLKAADLARWDTIAASIRRELDDIGLDAATISANLDMAEVVYHATPRLGLLPYGGATTARSTPVRVPSLAARFAMPAIEAPGTSSLRRTSGWRAYRPQINLSHCSRCFLCFALCPDGAIYLDEEHYPWVDYEHCKGCLVCVHECPAEAIREIREAVA